MVALPAPKLNRIVHAWLVAVLGAALVVAAMPMAQADEGGETARSAPTVAVVGSPVPTGAAASLEGSFDTDEPIDVWAQVWLDDRGDWSNTPRQSTTADGSFAIPLTWRSNQPGTSTWRAAAEFPDGEIQFSDGVQLSRTDGLSVDAVASQPVGATGTLSGTITTHQNALVWGEVWVPAQNRWSGTPKVRPGRTGAFSIPLVYQAHVAGDTTWRVAVQYADGAIQRGAELTFTRTAAGTLNVPAVTPAGVRSALTGKITTSRAVPVWGEVWVPAQSRWSRTPRTRSAADGSFSITLDYQMDRQGTTTWRVGTELPGGVISHTNQVSFARTPAATLTQPISKPVNLPGTLKGKFSTTGAIDVWGEVWIASEKRWSRTARVRTSSNGSYTIPLTYQMGSRGNTVWRVGGEHLNGLVEYTRQVTFTRAAAATVSSPGSLATGVEGALTGNVSTSRAVNVWAEVWVPAQSRWSRTPVRRTTASGSYSIPLNYQMGVAGTTTWRVGVEHVDGAVEYTRQVSVTRTKAPAVDRRCLTGRVLCASKTTNQMHWMINGRIIETVDVRYGRPGLETREGVFQVGWKSRHHVSSIYGTPMPYSMFFSGGQAVHYSEDFRRRGWVGGSGGCINVRDEATLAKIYSQVRVGDRVVVYW